MTIRSRWLTVFCMLLLLAACPACGWKTQPQIPDSPRPEAIKDIKVVTRDAVAYLSWPLPTKNVEGKPLSRAELRQFRIDRAEIKRDRKRPRYKLHTDLDLADPAAVVVKDGMVFWVDKDLKYDLRYSYRIRSVSVRGGTSAWSDEVRIAPLLSLAIPQHVAVEVGDGSVLLSWSPVTTRMDGSRHEGFVGYNIYRSLEQGRYSETPLTKEPLRTNSYQDSAVVNNKTYYYIVRAVDSPTPPWKESLDSSEASAEPSDLTPPDRPAGLTAVPGVDRVFLTWNENKESDLAGYHVYRSTKRGKDYERLTEKPLLRTTYSDEAVKANTTYYYIILAVDKAGNESARSDEKKAFVEELRKKFRIRDAT